MGSHHTNYKDSHDIIIFSVRIKYFKFVFVEYTTSFKMADDI